MRRVVLLVAFMFAVSLTGRADTVTTFDLNATLNNGFGAGSAGSVTGTVTIDVTTGVVTGLDVLAVTTAANSLGASSTTFDSINSQTEEAIFPPFYEVNSITGGDELSLNLPVSSLDGYTGGPVCVPANCALAGVYSIGGSGVNFDSGSLTAETAATPEPSSLALLGSGVLGFAGLLRRRKCC